MTSFESLQGIQRCSCRCMRTFVDVQAWLGYRALQANPSAHVPDRGNANIAELPQGADSDLQSQQSAQKRDLPVPNLSPPGLSACSQSRTATPCFFISESALRKSSAFSKRIFGGISRHVSVVQNPSMDSGSKLHYLEWSPTWHITLRESRPVLSWSHCEGRSRQILEEWQDPKRRPPTRSKPQRLNCGGRQPNLLKHQVSQHLCMHGASLDGVVIDSLPVPILGLFAAPSSNQPLLFGQTNFQLFGGKDQQNRYQWYRGARYCIRASGQFANHRNSKLKEMTTTWYGKGFRCQDSGLDASLLALPLELALEACFQGPSWRLPARQSGCDCWSLDSPSTPPEVSSPFQQDCRNRILTDSTQVTTHNNAAQATRKYRDVSKQWTEA